MADFTSYTCKDGDRWDIIAFQAYGDVKYIDLLIQSNPDIPVEVELLGGTVLRIPILDVIETNEDLLPPWKR